MQYNTSNRYSMHKLLHIVTLTPMHTLYTIMMTLMHTTYTIMLTLTHNRAHTHSLTLMHTRRTLSRSKTWFLAIPLFWAKLYRASALQNHGF